MEFRTLKRDQARAPVGAGSFRTHRPVFDRSSKVVPQASQRGTVAVVEVDLNKRTGRQKDDGTKKVMFLPRNVLALQIG